MLKGWLVVRGLGNQRWIGVLLSLAILLIGAPPVRGVTPEFAALHRETVLPAKDVVLKKILFTAGLMNAGYQGMNDLVAGLQLAVKNADARTLSAQLLAVRVGLESKPALLRHIAREIRFCEVWPNFPLGFADSAEGPDKISEEFEIMARHIEGLNIQFQSADFAVLKKEAERVVFAIFWTDGEKIRSLCQDVLTFVRIELKEDLPFEVFAKPRPSAP